MDGLNNRLDIAKTRISELEEKSKECIQNIFQQDRETENIREFKRCEG